MTGPHDACDTGNSRGVPGLGQPSPGAPVAGVLLAAAGTWSTQSFWLPARAGRGFSGPFSRREPAGIAAGHQKRQRLGAGGLDGYQRQTPRANAFVAAFNSLRCLCWEIKAGRREGLSSLRCWRNVSFDDISPYLSLPHLSTSANYRVCYHPPH